MINNYKYPYYYPQPQPLRDDYKYASQRLEMQLPLPGYSVKLPFTEKPTRMLNVNRRKREIDYLRDHIQLKVDMHELHYQAKIQQMRKQNQYNRLRLQKMLNEQPRQIFQVPEMYSQQYSSLGENLDNVSLQRLNRQKQRYLDNSFDNKKANGRNNDSRRGQSLSYNQPYHNQDEQDSNDSDKQAEQKLKKQRQLNYIYKKDGSGNVGNLLGVEPIIAKKIQKEKEIKKEKKQEYEWVQKVRQAMGKNYKVQDDSHTDTESTDSQKQKKKQKQSQKQQQSQRVNQLNAYRSNQNGSRSARVAESRNSDHKQMAPRRQLISQRRQQSQIAQQQISNMSQFSRLAERKQILKNKTKTNQNKNIFDTQYIPSAEKRKSSRY